LQYLKLIPMDPAASGKAPDASEKHETTPRRSQVSEKPSVKKPLAELKTSLSAITDRLAEIRPAIEVPDVVNNVDVDESRRTVVADSEFSKGPSRLSDAVPTPLAQVRDGIYTPDLVDEPVAPRPGNPKPRYPESLRAAGVEADVNVQFVVDSTGRVDEPSIKFQSHIHELFMDAIRVSLRRARFFPARLAGSLVPQLVQQEFRFELRERR
jgi:TonB family protein